MFEFYIPIAIIVLLLIFIILSIFNAVKLKKISRNCKDGNLGKTITTYYDNVNELSQNIFTLSKEFAEYEKKNKQSLQKIGLHRFDAFSDISGKLSFSLALLNHHNNGVIITSLYIQNTSNVYVREIVNAKADVHLLDEESIALEQAINQH